MKRLLLLFGLVSWWSLAIGQCPPLSAPYFEDFSTINNSATGTNFNNCWVGTTTSDPKWESEKSGTGNSSNTGPTNDNSFGFGTDGFYAYLETSSGALNDTGGFMSPAISLTGVTSPELSFYYHMYGADMGELEVQIWNGTQWDSVWAISGEQQTSATEAWRWAKVSLASYSGNIKVKFLGSRGSSFEGDMSIDDIRIAGATGCTDSISNVVVKNIAAFEGDVVWDGNAGATSWEIHYYETGADFYSGTTITATSDSVRLTGLQSDTEYRVFIRQACSGSGFGPWSAANQLQTLISCPAPTAFMLSAVPTTTSADLSWTTGGATSWIIEYDTVGFAPGTGRNVVVANTSTNYILSGLTVGTYYDIYVRDFCMAGDSSTYVGPITLSTSCNAITAPYFNDFESDLLDMNPLCWLSYKTNSSAFVEVENFTGTGAPYAGSQALYLYSGSSSTTPGVDTLIAISPQFSDLVAGDKQIRFWANSQAPADSLIIGTISSPSPTATFTPIDTIYFATANTYQEVISPITAANGYNGTDQYIVLAHNLGVTTDYIRIDDFTYEQIPACTKVSGIVLDTVTAFTATFSFTSTGTDFDYEWGPTGYTFGQATATTGAASGNPMTVSGFQPATTYDIYIRNNCTASSNGTSVWEGPFTFTTACYFVAPFTENFESYTPGQFGSNIVGCFTGSRTSIPRWETEDANGADENSTLTGPYTDGSGNPTGMYLFLETSGGALGNADSIVTAYIDISALTNPFIQFDYHMYGQTMGDLEVSYEDNGVWTKAITLSGEVQTAGSDPWAPAFAAITPSSDSIRIKIKGIRGSDFYSDMSIDNFSVIEAPACIPSIFLTLENDSTTASQAFVSWTPGSGLGYEIEWGSTGYTPGFGAVGSTVVTDTFYTITGLAPSTPYDVYVRDSCNGSYSTYTGPVSFITKCLSATMPYYESFDTWPLTCWGQTGTANWTEDQTNTPDHYAMANFYSNSTGVYELNSGPISITQDAQVRFKWSHLFSTFYPDEELQIRAQVVGTGVWNTILSLKGANDFNDPTAGNTTPGSFVESAVLLDPAIYTGHDVIIQIKGFSDWGPNCYVNDFYVENAPACPDPYSLDVTSMVDTAAVLDWGVSPSYTHSQVWFGPQGFYQGSQTLPGMGSRTLTTYDTLHIDTLSANTCYEYVVRGICGAGDTTAWVGPFQFCTPCSIANMPYTETFDAWPLSCWDNSKGSYPWIQYTGPGGDNYSEANYWSVSSGNDLVLTSRPINIDQDAWVKFKWSHLYNTSYPLDELILRAQVTSTGVWDTLFQKAGPNLNDPTAGSTVPGNFIQEYLFLDVATYTGEVVVFELIGNSGFGPDLFVNDFVVENAPTCPFPSNLSASNPTTTTVDLNWTTGGATAWQIEYGPVGFTPGQGTKVGATTNPFTVPGLTPGTDYDFYVRDSCAVGDVSLPIGPVTMQTLCTFTLSGPYTIGASGGYATLDSIVDVLNNCGVSGPVTINLGGGSHNAITLGNILGASATNTVTFMGSANYGDTIDGNGGTFAVDLNNAGYVNFDGICIRNTGYFVAWLHNDANHISFDNCYLEGSRTTTLSAAVIAATASSTSSTSYGDNANNVSITNNTIVGNYYGVSFNGTSTTDHINGLTVSDNDFEDQYYYGIRAYYVDSVELHNNHIPDFRNTSSYGLYCYYNDIINITGNYIGEVGTYGLYLYYSNIYLAAAPTTHGLVANNMFNSTSNAGIYCYSPMYMNFYHNTSQGGGTYGGMYLSGSTTTGYESVSLKNNIFAHNATGYAFYLATVPSAPFTLNHNLYYTPGASLAYQGGAQANLAAWQTAQPTLNMNSVEGNPLFYTSTDLHVLGGLANDVGDNTLGITTDIDGDPRPATGSTVVDMGADEYTPVSGDLDLIAGDFKKEFFCLSTTDTIVLQVKNLIGATTDFSTTPLVATYNVTGPVNSSGTITKNTGTLPLNDTVELAAYTVDLSIPGTYTLNAYIAPNADNALTFNDTLVSVTFDVDSVFTVNPGQVTLVSTTDSAELKANSPFFGGGSFFISEVMHFKTTTGAPTGGWPTWHSADEYIEITGIPGADLGGITFEQWNVGGTTPIGVHTFPQGTLLSPNGTAIISMRTVTPSPADFYYDGSGGNTLDWQSAGGQGVILKDASGNIIDAVAYPTYTFPAASGVTAVEWSGAVTGAPGSTCGIRLEGPDLNNGSNWLVSSASFPQDPNLINNGVVAPSPTTAAGLTWTLNGVTVSTVPTIKVRPTSTGSHWYVATYVSPCGITYKDSVEVIVPTCLPPSGLAGSALSSSSVSLGWDTTGVGATNYEIEYGPAGFTPGTGTSLSSTGNSTTVTGLAANLCQEFYLRAVCSPTDNSPWIGPISVCPEATICTDDMESYATGLIDDQSALFVGWQGGSAGDATVSTTRSSSGSQSMRVTDLGSAAATDIVAYFDTISSGAWEVSFEMYVETGDGAYFNIQQNHDLTAVSNQWNAEVYFQPNGTVQVQHSASSVIVGTFNYSQGQWISVSTIIDLTLDTIWFELNGTSTGIGFPYSAPNPGAAMQFNGVNFYSGVLGTATYDIDYYIDDFCVSPYAYQGCNTPVALSASSVGCDSLQLNWTSLSGNNNSSLIEYGPTGFTPGTGTFVSYVNSPTIISGLTPGTAYQFYVADTCGTTDTSAYAGPFSVSTLSGPLPVASFTPSVNGFTVNFDASGSTNATTYDWDFGDGNSGTGVNTSNTYTTGGSYSITLTVSNGCGTDDTTIVISDVSLGENTLQQSLVVYPNPSQGMVNISFSDANGDVQIRVLDLSGKEVMVFDETAKTNMFEQSIDISKLAKGVYMLEISSGSLKANKRLVKN